MVDSRDYNARCPSCKKVVPDLSMTLQYYNGVIIPDTSAVFAGILSKDLGSGTEHFFENFKVLLHSKDYDECDNKGGRAWQDRRFCIYWKNQNGKD